MTREEAIRIIDGVIQPPDHHTVDLYHLPIAQAWAELKEELSKISITTLYGYKLHHLAFVAALLQHKGVTEENLADVLNSVDWIVGMVLEEAKEKTIQSFIKNEVEE